MKKLTELDVEFEVTIKPELIPVRGNAMCSGDDEFDKSVESEIEDRLERGEIEAWCCVVVTARWNGFEAQDSLGCVSAESEADALAMVDWHEMRSEALEALNAEIASTANRLESLRS